MNSTNPKASKKILIIDDDKSIRESFAAHFDDLFYQVLLASDGTEGLQIFEKEKPDLALVDLRLPGINGLEVLVRIKNSSPLTPIIVISGNTDVKDSVEAIRMGAWDYLVKPVEDLSFLTHRAEAALEKAKLLKENTEYQNHLEQLVLERTEELERTNEELKISKFQAEDANAAKTAFLANVTHEMRTPLNSVLGMIELLAEKNLDEDQKEKVQIITRNGNILLKLIDDILDFSKIEKGKIQLVPISLEIREFINEIVATYSSKEKVKANKLVIVHHIDDSVPKWIIADPLRLSQIIYNIIENAIKFTDTGEIKLTIDPNTDNCLRFSISDTGIGIPHTKIPHLFKSFYQVDNGPTKKHGGTGLGLSIAQGLAELMKGSITCHSELNKGTTFEVIIPLQEALHPSCPIQPVSIGPLPKGVVNVLLVDDSEDNRVLIKHYLKSFPCNITEALNGKEAVHLAKENQFEIILMDISMPIMDGYTATAAIREYELSQWRPRSYIIALTAYTLEHEKEQSFQSGCDGHLSKPVKKSTLLQVLTDYLKRPK